jgi:hypothetical protein
MALTSPYHPVILAALLSVSLPSLRAQDTLKADLDPFITLP